MNTEKLKEISTSDYGSTYQGLADEYSDVDTFTLVRMPLREGLFHDLRKQSTQDADKRTLLTPQRLIQLGLKGSVHSLILLSAQLKQHDDELPMQSLFKTFYKDDVFEHVNSIKQDIVDYLIKQEYLVLKSKGGV